MIADTQPDDWWLVTYADVARRLPRHIVDAIEVTGPCPVAGRHTWCQEEVIVGSWIGEVRRDVWWECYSCQRTTDRDPREHLIPPGDPSPSDLWVDHLLGH